MSKLFRTFLLSAALIASMTVQAQVYVGDYTMDSYVSGYASITSTGTQLASIEMDDAATMVSLPFTFPFGEEEHTSVYVSSNGQIGLGADPATSGYMPHTDDMSVIVPMGFDFNLSATNGGGHVYYEVQGYAPDRVMVIEYDHVRPYSTSPTSDFCSFQVALHETGDIEFFYDTCSVSASQAAYAFLYEHSAHSMLALSGSWSSLGTSHTASAIGLSATNAPQPGLNVLFTRVYNSCMRPTDFICRSSSNPDSVVLAWTPAEYTNMWEIRYDTVGTSVESMTHVYTGITDSFYVCRGLHLGGTYEAYLRTDCGAEQSFWVGPITITPGLYVMPVTGSHTIYGCDIMIYDNGGSTANYSNNCSSTLVVYPSSPDSIVVLSGTVSTEECCDYLLIYDGEGTRGNLLYRGQGLNLTIPTIRSNEGPVTLYFYSEGSVTHPGFAIHVGCEAAPQCRTISEVEVSHVAGASAFVEWTLRGNVSNPAYYIVNTYNLDNPSATVLTDTTSNLYYAIAGLEPTTNYRTVVSSVCNDSIIVGDSVDFATRCLVGGLTSPSGTVTSQTSGIPVNSGWGNTFCQSIFTPAELTAMGLTPGPIQGITYTWASAGSYQKDFTIFMGHTTVNTFSSFAPLSGSMTQVYHGMRNTTDVGTVEYYFTTPFVWDGTSNIVVSSFVNQPSGSSHASSGFNAYSTNCSVTRSIYAYRDNTAYTTSTLTGNTGTSTYRPNISFIKPCDTTATCAAPNVIVTNVGDSVADIVWAPGYQESSWDIYYRVQEDTAWTFEASTIERSHTIANLLPMRSYVVKVVPDCGGDSVMGMVEFTTPCVAITTLPFNEDFEHFTATSTLGSPITDCWHRGTNYSSSFYPYASTTYAHSGSKSIYFYAYSSYYSYLALPSIGIPMDSLQVSFAAYKTSATYSLQVGVMTDPEDFSTFTQVATVTPDNAATWQMFEVPLGNYRNNGRYIAFACDGGTNYMYLDDIEVSYILPCPRPTDVNVSGITLSSATVHWTDTATHFFEVEYGHSGFAHGTGTTLTTTDDSVTLYGLSHSTNYDVYVRGICGDDTSNWSFLSTFATNCGVIDSLPYSVNFLGYGTGTSARPNCWACGGYSSYPYITNVSDASGNPIGQALYMYSYSSNQVYAIMPPLDSISYPIEMTQVVFRAWTNSSYSTSYSHKVIVGISQDNANGLSLFTPVDTIELTATPALYEISFEDFAGTGKYISFVSVAQGGAAYNYVYLDSVTIELIPDCQRPNHLSASGITHNTADIDWTERGTANTWQIEYGPRGFVLGSGTRVTASSTPFTLTGLSSSTDYEFYVRSSCDVNVYSEWSRTPGFFSTRQNPAAIPYHYDFEDGAEWGEWQTNSNESVNWYRGTAVGDGANGLDVTGTYAMYVSADTGRTCSTNMNAVVNASAYRDIDFGTSDTTLQFSFRAKAGGTTTAAYDALVVFLADPSVPVLPTSANLTSPWGNVNDLTPLTPIIRLSLNWNTYSTLIEGVSGVHRLVFFWFNQATGETAFLGDPAAVDEIHIEYQECPRPSNFRTENLGVTTTDVTWVGPEDGLYYVILRHNGSLVASDTVNTNRVHFTNLGPGTTYSLQARRICSETDSSEISQSFSFKTKVCGGGITDTIGDPTNASTSYHLPIDNYYNYSYSQQIYNASELSGAGEINAISFYYTGTSAMTHKTQCSIYLAHTSLSDFMSVNDFVPFDSLQLVYTGALNGAPGWNTVTLNNTFLYNGDSNLVLAIDDNSGSYDGTSYTFAVASAVGTPAMYLYSDGNNPDPANPASLSSLSASRSSLRNVVAFDMCPPSSCPQPVLLDPIIRQDSVVLRWRNSGQGYQLNYGYAERTTNLAEGIVVTDTFYVLSRLAENREYRYEVRQFCDSSSVSSWARATFNSSNIPCLPPTNLRVSNITHKSAKLAWTRNEGNIGYEIHIFNTITDMMLHSVGTSKTISGLVSGVTYNVAVRSECADLDDPSAWSDTITFTTDVCPDVSNVTVSNVQGNSVVLDWTEGGRAEEWEIQWGPQGFDQGGGNAITVIASEHPYTLTGLTGDSDYDVYVRAKCGNDFFSQHWAKASFSTPFSSISNIVDDGRVLLSPNPATDEVTITIPAVSGKVFVELIDITGRLLQRTTLPEGSEQAVLPLDNLAAGTYYIRVVGNLHAVKKLIVR